MDRVPTGIAELDEILDGGLPAGSLAVLAGPPGTGKTILAQQLAFSASTEDHPALYYTTLSESHAKMRRHLSSLEFYDASKLDGDVQFLHVTELLQGTDDDDRGLDAFFDEILHAAFDKSPSMIVVDSFKSLHHFVTDNRMREAVFDLASKVSHTGALLLLVGEYTEDEILTDPEFAVADAILEVSHDIDGPVDRRYLRVRKLRGSASLMGKHAFQITDRGYELFPRPESLAPRPPAIGGDAARLRQHRARPHDQRRPAAGRGHAGHGTVRRGQDRAVLRVGQRGPGRRRAVPVRLLRGIVRAATAEGPHLRMGVGRGRRAGRPHDPARPADRAGHRRAGPPGSRAGREPRHQPGRVRQPRRAGPGLQRPRTLPRLHLGARHHDHGHRQPASSSRRRRPRSARPRPASPSSATCSTTCWCCGTWRSAPRSDARSWC